jgi:hypothetical protein
LALDAWEARCPGHGSTDPALAISRNEFDHAVLACRTESCQHIRIVRALGCANDHLYSETPDWLIRQNRRPEVHELGAGGQTLARPDSGRWDAYTCERRFGRAGPRKRQRLAMGDGQAVRETPGQKWPFVPPSPSGASSVLSSDGAIRLRPSAWNSVPAS